jgi:large subunit ribosomal protein L30
MKLFVVRLRGRIGLRNEVNSTLDSLGLKRRFNALIVDSSPVVLGMLKKVQNFVAYGELSDENYTKLLTLPSSIKEEKKGMLLLRLPPPRFGLKKTIKKLYPKGEAGYRGKEINSLVERFLINVKT